MSTTTSESETGAEGFRISPAIDVDRHFLAAREKPSDFFQDKTLREVGDSIVLVEKRMAQVRKFAQRNLERKNGELVLHTGPDGKVDWIGYQFKSNGVEVEIHRIDQSEFEQTVVDYKKAQALLEEGLSAGTAEEIPADPVQEQVIRSLGLKPDPNIKGYHLPVNKVDELPFTPIVDWDRVQAYITKKLPSGEEIVEEVSKSFRRKSPEHKAREYHSWKLICKSGSEESRVQFRQSTGEDILPRLDAIDVEKKSRSENQRWDITKEQYGGYFVNFAISGIGNGYVYAGEIFPQTFGGKPVKSRGNTEWRIDSRNSKKSEQDLTDLKLIKNGESVVPGFSQIAHQIKETLSSVV